MDLAILELRSCGLVYEPSNEYCHMYSIVNNIYTIVRAVLVIRGDDGRMLS